MLCVSITDAMSQKLILINNKLSVSRVYISDEDINSFPNRIVVVVSADICRPLLAEVESELTEADVELLAEVARLCSFDTLKLVVPVALRVQDEAFTSFLQREKASNRPSLPINSDDYHIFLKGREVPRICVACARQAELKGNPCPDYAPNSFNCLKTSNFKLEAMDTFYINEKGDLMYNAATIEKPAQQ